MLGVSLTHTPDFHLWEMATTWTFISWCFRNYRSSELSRHNTSSHITRGSTRPVHTGEERRCQKHSVLQLKVEEKKKKIKPPTAFLDFSKLWLYFVLFSSFWKELKEEIKKIEKNNKICPSWIGRCAFLVSRDLKKGVKTNISTGKIIFFLHSPALWQNILSNSKKSQTTVTAKKQSSIHALHIFAFQCIQKSYSTPRCIFGILGNNTLNLTTVPCWLFLYSEVEDLWSGVFQLLKVVED